MAIKKPIRIRTIGEFHRFRNLPKPEHPLISIIDLENVEPFSQNVSSLTLDFYSIAVQKNFSGKFLYGQQHYDFDAGIMFFMSPGQVFNIDHTPNEKSTPSGWKWVLLIHP